MERNELIKKQHELANLLSQAAKIASEMAHSEDERRYEYSQTLRLVSDGLSSAEVVRTILRVGEAASNCTKLSDAKDYLKSLASSVRNLETENI